MGRIASELASRGHDLQLHLHPVWTLFQDPHWADRAKQTRITSDEYDSMAVLSQQEAKELIQRGLDSFTEWRVPAPLAVRAGNLSAERTVHQASKELGLPLASNGGFGMFRSRDPALQLFSGRHWIDGVLEVPVTSYPDLCWGGMNHWKLLTIKGVGAGEMRAVLQSAVVQEVSPVVILTHASEFIHRIEPGHNRVVRPDRLARKRLISLCRFLSENSDRFTVTTFREQLGEWLTGEATPNLKLKAPLPSVARRLFENRVAGVYDRIWEGRKRNS